MAVFLGHHALSRIKKSGGALRGEGFAVGGLISGYLTCCIGIVAVISGALVTAGGMYGTARERNQVNGNLRQLGIALIEFDQEFGSFPSDDTAALVAKEKGVDPDELKGPLVLNQLKAWGHHPVEESLTVGDGFEGDWIYLSGQTTSGDPNRALLVSPAIRGKAVVLAVDCSIRQIAEPELGNLRGSPQAVEIPAPRR